MSDVKDKKPIEVEVDEQLSESDTMAMQLGKSCLYFLNRICSQSMNALSIADRAKRNINRSIELLGNKPEGLEFKELVSILFDAGLSALGAEVLMKLSVAAEVWDDHMNDQPFQTWSNEFSALIPAFILSEAILHELENPNLQRQFLNSEQRVSFSAAMEKGEYLQSILELKDGKYCFKTGGVRLVDVAIQTTHLNIGLGEAAELFGIKREEVWLALKLYKSHYSEFRRGNI